MSPELIGLAVLMAAVTYPSRAIPLLVPRFERLPDRLMVYLRLVGPAMLCSLAAAAVLVAPEGGSVHVGIELAAVLVCVVIVALRKPLLLGIAAAVAIVAIARATGLA